MARPTARKPKPGELESGGETELGATGEAILQTFFFFGRYTPEALREANSDRTEKMDRLIKWNGGHVGAVYALLGQFDLVMIVQFAGVEEAMKASVAMTRATGISWITAPAVEV